MLIAEKLALARLQSHERSVLTIEVFAFLQRLPQPDRVTAELADVRMQQLELEVADAAVAHSARQLAVLVVLGKIEVDVLEHPTHELGIVNLAGARRILEFPDPADRMSSRLTSLVVQLAPVGEPFHAEQKVIRMIPHRLEV